MIAYNANKHQVARLIATRGTEYKFIRFKKNEFGEPTTDVAAEVIVGGFFHEVTKQVTTSTSEATVTRSEPSPRIMCSVEDGKKIQLDDQVVVNGITYKVAGATDLGKLGVVCDVSLDVVQHGR